MVGRDHPWSISHRHYSHLLGVFPLALINPEVPGDSPLIQTSLQTWERDPSAFRGYSFTGAASMYAMLGEGDSAVVRLHRFLDFPKYNEPNTFYAEAGPVIETPLSAATSVQDLMLQSWGGALRVFPAIPDAWREADFDQLRGQGAFLVSAVRHGGRTAWVKVRSLAGEPCHLVVRDWSRAVVRSHTGPVPTVRAEGDGHFSIDLAKGASVVLAPDASTRLPSIAPVPEAPGTRSYYPDWTRTGAQH
ncbi:MAG TPA: hypothetical protein VFL93_01395, partial [Longimicrobiaceae bacterium]|nr:hypothetical protein [Longimicrobiaceae bacterium]